MRKSVAVLVGILVILCGIASLAGASVPIIPDLPGWNREAPEKNQVARFALLGEDGAVRATLFVSRLSYASEKEAQEYASSLKEPPLKKGAITVVEVEELLFQGRPWVVHHLQGELPEEEGEEPGDFEAQKFFSREGRDIYAFQFLTYPEYFEELRPRFVEWVGLVSFEEEGEEKSLARLPQISQTTQTPQRSSENPKVSEEEDEFVDKFASKKTASSKPLEVTPMAPPSPTATPTQPRPLQIPPQESPAAPGIPQGLGALGTPKAVAVPEAPSRFNLEIFPGPEWTPNPPLDSSISQYYLLIQQGVNMAEMMVFEEDFDAPVTLQNYAQVILSQAPQLFGGYSVGQNWDTSINGVPVKVHEFFFLAPGSYTRLIGRAYIFLGGPKRGYVVLFDTADQSYPYMAPKFDGVMRTLSLRPETPVSPQGQSGYPQTPPSSSSLPQPQSQPLPGTGLPSFGGSPDPGIYEDLSKGLRVTLPSGAILTETLPQGRRYTLADGVDLTLLNLASPQEMESRAAQLLQGKAFQGESIIQGRGTSGQVGLYAFSHPQTSAPYATLVARYPQASLLMILTLPRDNYQRAAEWMLPFLESVSLGR